MSNGMVGVVYVSDPHVYVHTHTHTYVQRGVLANSWPRKKIVLQEDREAGAVAE